MVVGAVPGLYWSWEELRQLASANANTSGVKAAKMWFPVLAIVLKSDEFSSELVSVKSNHSHCVSGNNSPCFSSLTLAGSRHLSLLVWVG